MLNHVKLWNNRKWHLSWWWWPLTILSSNLLKVRLTHWSKMFWKCTSIHIRKVMVMKMLSNTSGTLSLMMPLLLRVSAGRCTPSWLSAILMIFIPSIQVRLQCWEGTTRHQHRFFCTWHINLDFGMAQTHLINLRLGQSKWRLMVNLCWRPFDMTIKASHTRRNSIMNVMKKGKVWSPVSWDWLEIELNR